MPDPTPPRHPLGSVDVRLLRAWLEAQLAHPGDQRASVAAVTTVINGYRNGRRLMLADMWTSLPDWLRPILALPHREGLNALLGDWSRAGEFIAAEAVPERWRLTEEECELYRWEVDNGLSLSEMQERRTAKALRPWRERWVSVEVVAEPLERARAKVRGMFGLE
jgi:hypothetical protein